MKISTSLELGTAKGLSPEESARMMREAGFDGIDLGLCGMQHDPASYGNEAWTEKTVREIRAAKAEGLALAQCHLPYYPGHLQVPGTGDYADFEAFMLPMYRRAIAVCGEHGCPVAVMHPYFHIQSASGTVEGNRRMIEKLMPDLRRTGVKLALENVYGYVTAYTSVHLTTAEDIQAILNVTDPAYVGACIDTGHANIFGVDICGMARKLGSRLTALHANDNHGGDEHILPGACNTPLDFTAFSQALREIGYKGYYNLEIGCGKVPPTLMAGFYRYAAATARAFAGLAE